jgi:hypothetical protein
MSKTVLFDQKTDSAKTDAEKGTLKAKKIDFSNINTGALKKPSIKTTDIDSYLNDYKEGAQVVEPDISEAENEPIKTRIRRSKKKVEPSILTGDILTGAMFIALIDLALPMIIVTLNNTLDKNHKITVDKLRLKASQRKELEPIAEEVMKQLELKANPIVILIISLVSLYGLNFVNLKYGLE